MRAEVRRSFSLPFELSLMPKPQSFLLVAVCAFALSFGLSASADSVDTDAEARALYEAGRIAFDQGRFEAALRYFETSYELSGRPQLLFNIGTVADRLRRDDLALRAFKRFLEEVPDTPERQGVLARIRILERSAIRADGRRDEESGDEEASDELALIDEIGFDEENEQTDIEDELAGRHSVDGRGVDLSAGVTPHTQKRSGKRGAGLALAAAGAGALVGGTVTLALGQRRRNEIEDAPRGTFYASLPNGERADRMTAAGIGVLAAGAGILTGGLVMLVNARSKRDETSLEFSVNPFGFEFRGDF